MAPPSVCVTFLLFNLAAVYFILALPEKPVAQTDILFVTCSLLYAILANAVSDRPAGPPAVRRTLSPSPRIVRLFFPFTATLSLLAPWALLLSRRVLSPILAPHLFVLHAQLAAETFTYMLAMPPRGRVSIYVRVALPIAFVAYRLPMIYAWWVAATNAPVYAALLRALALANGAFWSIMFFGFLLPFVLHRNFNIPGEHSEQVDSGRKR